MAEITCGSVVIQREKFKLRCRLGLHRWRLFTMAHTFIEMFPDRVNVERECRYCHALMTVVDDDGVQKWQGRL